MKARVSITRPPGGLPTLLVGLVVAAGASAGCRQLNLPDGSIHCSAQGHCPSPYQCHADKLCYGPTSSDAAADSATDAAADSANDAATDGLVRDVAAEVGETGAPVDAGTDADAGVVVPKITVTIARTGNGTVTGPGVDCTDATCVVSIDSGSSLVLQANPGNDSDFKMWSSCTSTDGTSCSLVNVTAPVQVSVAFAIKNANFVILKDGNGSGSVTATWAGGSLVCGTACSGIVPQGTIVTLQATPSAGSTVTWGTPCSGGGTCMITAGIGETDAKATFTLSKVTLTIAETGSGAVSGTGGITCAGPSCDVPVDYGSSVVLTATPAANYGVMSWSGCTSTSGNTCTISSITAAAHVSVTFVLGQVPLTITRSGNGAGTVSASWPGGGSLTCPTGCSAQIALGTTVTLTATPSTGSSFAWGAPTPAASGTCSGAGSCTVSVVSGGTTVPAVFTLNQFVLSVTIAGPAGSGSVLASSVGINCGSTCAASVNYGTAVQLTATPSSSGAFAGWTGCTSVSGTTCTVNVMQTTGVKAAFTRTNGNPCASTADCNSGFCVGGACCASACPGVGVTNGCNASCSGGVCQPSPRRTACGTARPNTPLGDPGFNDVALFCDGTGNCIGPTVTCSLNSDPFTCAISGSQVCCSLYTGMNSAEGFPIFAAGCGDPTKCGGIATLDGQLCASSSDCPMGMICCDKHHSNSEWAVCSTVAACSAGGDLDSASQICDPAGPICPAGTSCSFGDVFYDCQ